MDADSLIGVPSPARAVPIPKVYSVAVLDSGLLRATGPDRGALEVVIISCCSKEVLEASSLSGRISLSD